MKKTSVFILVGFFLNVTINTCHSKDNKNFSDVNKYSPYKTIPKRDAVNKMSIKKVGIIAGSGDLVNLIIQGCQSRNFPFHIVALKGQSDEKLVNHYSHTWLHLGQAGAIIKDLKAHHCTHIVMAGRVERPQSLTSLKTDIKGALLIAKLIPKVLGDDCLLKTIIGFFEKEGFMVVGAETLMSDDNLCEEGVLTKKQPDKQMIRDIQRGLEVLQCLSPQDVGQSCIVQNGIVLGIEAVEGTDKLIKRCHDLRHSKSGGVLIKALKIGQDTRVDRAVVGEQTIINLAENGFQGLAVQANGVILLNKQQVIAKADQLGIYIIGVSFDKVKQTKGK